MKNMRKISIYLQIGLLFTFFLPFFPSSCKDAQGEPSIDTTIVEEFPVPEVSKTDDSIKALISNDNRSDTLENKSDTLNKSFTPDQSDVEETFVDKVIQRFHFLRLLLKPNNKYSGLGYVIDVFGPLATSFGIVLSLILWIIGLRLKKKENQDFHILNIAGLVFLYTTNPAMLAWLSNSRLWGYWFCFWWAAAMIVLDLSLTIKKKITGA